jgi:hypothetical protein
MIKHTKLSLLAISIVLVFSYKDKKPKEFVQPKKLEKKSGFNFSQINFKANVLELVLNL